jgi:hypothetical protein
MIYDKRPDMTRQWLAPPEEGRRRWRSINQNMTRLSCQLDCTVERET